MAFPTVPWAHAERPWSLGFEHAPRAVVAAVPGSDLDLVGIGVHGPKNAVDKIMKGTHLHP
jgi:hypothetical protein